MGLRGKVQFKHYEESDFQAVCDFLIEINQKDKNHINWNWARWEWMFFHPEFDKSLMERIGLWFCGEDLAGLAVYDHYLGEGFIAAKKEIHDLENEVLKYAIHNFCDENGFGIAVNDTDSKTADFLSACGFVRKQQDENVLELILEELNTESEPLEGVVLENINLDKDMYKHHEVLWKGFDHEGTLPLDEATIHKQKFMLTAPHLNPLLHIMALNERAEAVAYCGLWYVPNTDYVYVEPVCTIPEYRNQGIAKVALTEAFQRAKALGAKKAYVISDSGFYKKMGFRQHSHYTFYWYQNQKG